MPSRTPCLCTRVMLVDGEIKPVRGWRWTCPSCGPDKRRALADAAAECDARRIITATLLQPHAIGEGGLPFFPAGFEECDWETHVSPATTDGTLRWKRQASCQHCCREVSAMLTRWRKRMRRRWPELETLRVYEAHKAGGMHVHILCAGLPRTMGRKTRSGRKVKEMWAEVGGGFVDVGWENRDSDGSRKAGGYAAKYLTKAAGRAIASGFRVWTRTRGFGTGIPIPGSRLATALPAPPRRTVLCLGWWDPYAGEITQRQPSERLAKPPPT